MRYKVRLAARADLKRHWKKIAEEDASAADRFLAAVEVTFSRIARQPALMGHALGWRRHAKVRSFRIPKFRRYLIFFAVRPRHVEFKRVLYGMRNLPRLFRLPDNP